MPEKPMQNLEILSKVSEMAEQIGSKEARAQMEGLFLEATYAESCAIVEEARVLLATYLLNPKGIKLQGSQLGAVISVAEEIGKLASALNAIRGLL